MLVKEIENEKTNINLKKTISVPIYWATI